MEFHEITSSFSIVLIINSHILFRKLSKVPTLFCFQETSTPQCKYITQVLEVGEVQHTAIPLYPVIFLSLISNSYSILPVDWPNDLQKAHR
jgi:hypothetical protein